MLFSSIEFIIFFCIYLLFHFSVPSIHRNKVIIVGSLIFYGWWNPKYILLPTFLTTIAFLGTIHLDSMPNRARRTALIVTIVLLLLPLFIFKYSNFFINNINLIIDEEIQFQYSFLLPLGISFITFTLISYVVDVYKGKYPIESNFANLNAYILFFPQLIAGPILRAPELLPQLKASSRATFEKFHIGLCIFSFGIFKKLCIADQIGLVVDQVYAQPQHISGLQALLAFYGFSVQIYCDFSGYTDMAIGLGLILGIKLPKNFSRPYLSTSIVEFWRRWHITLSFWLRDYLYIPLGGNRVGHAKHVRNLLITMILGGLWHGAGWTFILWGLAHGLAIVISHLISRREVKISPIINNKYIKIFLVFHFVSICWLLFRSPNLEIAYNLLSAPFMNGMGDIPVILSNNIFPISIISIFFIILKYDDIDIISSLADRFNKSILISISISIIVISMLISSGSSAEFIYFDF